MKKANEYKAWYRKKNPQNAREGFNEHNRDFDERYQRPSEYYRRPDEYQHFQERYDYTADQEETKKQKRKRQDQQSNKANVIGKNVIKAVVKSTVGLVVGALVIVVGYRAIKAKEVTHVFTPGWVWSDDYQTATLVMTSEDNSIKKEFPAVVTLDEEVAPTCIDDGYRTYTAIGSYETKEYTDTQTEALHALGHRFDEGTLVDGDVEYTCLECGEHLVVHVHIDEND